VLQYYLIDFVMTKPYVCIYMYEVTWLGGPNVDTFSEGCYLHL